MRQLCLSRHLWNATGTCPPCPSEGLRLFHKTNHPPSLWLHLMHLPWPVPSGSDSRVLHDSVHVFWCVPDARTVLQAGLHLPSSAQAPCVTVVLYTQVQSVGGCKCHLGNRPLCIPHGTVLKINSKYTGSPIQLARRPAASATIFSERPSSGD